MTTPKITPEFYGLRGITHGSAKLLTVMSTLGKDTINEVVVERDDLLVYPEAGELVRFYEKRGGALDKLIQRYTIQVLNKTEWDDRKREIFARGK